MMSAFEYQITRSNRRKTLAVVIRHAEVKILAPEHVSLSVIKDFIRQRSRWIESKLAVQQQWQQQQQLLKKDYSTGESFLYFGHPLSLYVVDGSSSLVALQGDRLLVTLSSRVSAAKRSDHIKKLLQQWYKRRLTEYLHRHLDEMARQIGVQYTQLNVRSYKSRWGSCSSTGQLSFNLLLAMAPTAVVDYVMIHELCHLVHLNHSAQFWALVKHHSPQFEQAKAWLKTHSESLRLD